MVNVKMVNKALASWSKKDAPGSFINWLYDKSDVYAFLMPGSRYDIGDLKSYENAKVNYRGVKK